MKQTKSVEDYLETMLILEEKKGYIRPVDVADHLNFSKPSVTVAIHRLEEDGSVAHDAEGHIVLTEKGRAIARRTLERHRFLYQMLTDIGVSTAVADEDACGMEHSISDETFEALKKWYVQVSDSKSPGNA